jgi:small-conductance mechanosensitive channel
MREAREVYAASAAVLEAHPTVFALAIAAFFFLLALAIDRMCGRMVAAFLSNGDSATVNRVIELLRYPVILTVSSIGVILALQTVGLGSQVIAIIADVIRTGLVATWTVLAYRLFVTFASRARESGEGVLLSNAHAAQLVGNVTAMVLLIVAAYTILVTWDINVSALVASAGILGIALSLAAQETLANLFAGVSILADRPYAVGDYIVLDSGERGEVTDIGLRSTRLRTRDDVGITIPNGLIARAKVVNEEGGSKTGCRLRLKVGIAYGSDIRRACRVLKDVGSRHGDVLEIPDPRVRLRQFGESSLDFEVLGHDSDSDPLRLAARLRHEESGRSLQVLTSAPGVQVYTGNALPSDLIGKRQVEYGPMSGVCLETQVHPDSPNHRNFPDITIDQDSPFESTTVFRFSVSQ